MDAVHVSFVHQMGSPGTFGKAVSRAIPKLTYFETDAGIRQVATRADNNVRVSDWTFPNNNHIVIPGISKTHPWMELAIWLVPVDDEHTTRLQTYCLPSMGPEEDEKITEYFRKHVDYNPADHHDELFVQGKYPEETAIALIAAQDYVAVMGQGTIVDRASELLVRSDSGVSLQRRIFWREMEALRSGGEIKRWRRLNEEIELQTEGIRNAVNS
jgi:5,5'-dehydrodivanillate O-demethylase